MDLLVSHYVEVEGIVRAVDDQHCGSSLRENPDTFEGILKSPREAAALESCWKQRAW